MSHYYAVMLNQKPSYSQISSQISPTEFEIKPDLDDNDLNSLWKIHEDIRAKFKSKYAQHTKLKEENSPFSYLDLKVKLVEEIFKNCYFCERRCMVNREIEEGICRVLKPLIASEFLHRGEEEPLVPSHTIFFTGCNFQCVYCQNWDISQSPQEGMSLTEERLAGIIDRRRREGSRNVNFVGGDPTPNLHYILKTMDLTTENVPVVWNSNLYLSEESMYLLDGFVDLYLTDFKYGNSDCALRLSNVPDYWDVITRNHKIAQNSGDMIIRHLVLPNHVECCTKPILKWIYENLGEETVLNVMGQYRPVYGACGYEDISRFPSIQEIKEAKEYAQDLGFINLI